MKRCSHCETEKPPEAFYRDRTRSDGLFSWCKDCHKADYRATFERRRDAANERRREERRGPRAEFIRQRDRSRHRIAKDDPTYRLRRYRSAVWTRFRVTPEQLRDVLIAQDFRCGLCRKEFGDFKPHVDHDHACCQPQRGCGKCIRGYLCDNCNRRVLPTLEADSELQSQRVIDYLARRPLAPL